MQCLAALWDEEDVKLNKSRPLNFEHTKQDGTEADGNPNLVDYTEKVMLKQLDAYSVSIETMTLYNSLRNKVGENTKVEVPRDKLRVNIFPELRY